MRKFEFRLEPVLKQREAREEQAALEQARALEEYNRKLRRLTEARENLARVAQSDCHAGLVDWFNKLAYCEFMACEVKQRELEVNRSNKKLERCRNNLVQAMQERTVIEKLKEKQFSTYKLAVSRLEQKELDELAALRCARGQI
ncbi:flagellar export protein FliJ [Desulfallas sp. Bu1-1]|uniref:flagellar export protein FliJ n=1 Tax=Desulfallas sp. Bu1-1 TaxID=2787620 RepID=UPI00189E42EA|nr:flagellar export protein FliJ [Desulfallas sp. Bu1-1]MBF7081960.1 flagellar export protein FliJ [Desulfallas sp. Bu1-1]